MKVPRKAGCVHALANVAGSAQAAFADGGVKEWSENKDSDLVKGSEFFFRLDWIHEEIRAEAAQAQDGKPPQ